MRASRGAAIFWMSIAGVLTASRWAHIKVLWTDEDYHLAVAIQILHGKMPYRDVWYDKPPLAALGALLFGAWPGWPLRLACVGVALACCAIAFRFATQLWSPREGYIAAGLLAFYQIFYLATAVIPWEPDTLMMLPHLAAVYWAWSKRPMLAGLASGVAFLITPKGAFVLASALVVNPSGWPALGLGFMLPNAALAGWLVSEGALLDYWVQVWRWGMLYTAMPPSEPGTRPLLRILAWLGLHAGLLIPWAALRLARRPHPRLAIGAWVAISLIGATIGWRVPPRYMNQILPPLTIAAAGGLGYLYSRRSLGMLAFTAVALTVPVVRFTPPSAQLALDSMNGRPPRWDDVQLDRWSRHIADKVKTFARPGDTIVVWGYRPNIVVYTRLPIGSRYWDSQPLTTIPADRHFGESQPLDGPWARRNRDEFVRSKPDIVVDGLSYFNSDLRMQLFPDLAAWIQDYCQVEYDGPAQIYKRCAR